MRYLSVCSGIEAASAAWEPLNWSPVAFAEIEPFPSAVLAHHFPHVPNLGDMTLLPERIRSGEVEAPDILVGGTPCQAWSVAGLRGGLNDPRGQLTLAFVEVADAIDERRIAEGKPPVIIVWENVPGVLTDRGNGFGWFLGGLVGEDEPLVPAGRKWTNAGCVLGPRRTLAWRVLDAQHFGLAQRRKRVFAVASAGSLDPCAVLFEREGLRGDSPAGRCPEQVVAALTASGVGTCGPDDNQAQARHLIPVFKRRGGFGWSEGRGDSPTLEAQAGTHHGGSENIPLVFGPLPSLQTTTGIASALTTDNDGKRSSPRGDGSDNLVVTPIAFNHQSGGSLMQLSPSTDPANTLQANQGQAVLAFGGGRTSGPIDVATTQVAHPTRMDFDSETLLVQQSLGVRRLTPTECERLMGFRDGWTMIPWRGKPAEQCPDGHRHKALGNSKAVPVVHWIGRRIQAAVEAKRDERERVA